jgi:O-antigen ligase
MLSKSLSIHGTTRARNSNQLQMGGAARSAVIAPPVLSAVNTPIALSARQRAWIGDENNLVRKVGFVLTLAIVFIRFTGVHEWMTAFIGNTYILYLLVPPALLAFLASGGWRRMMEWRPAWYWLGFLGWLMLAIPLSSWKAGSLSLVFGYLRTELVMLFLIAGLSMTWSEVRRLAQVLAFSAFFNVVSVRFRWSDLFNDRLGLSTSAMGNPNDLAAQLVLMLPFLLIALLSPKVNTVFRIAAMGGLAYGSYLVLLTGSRGAMVALIVAVAYCWMRAPVQWKVVAVAILPVALIGLGVALPGKTVRRLMTMSTKSNSTDAVENEAAGSAGARTYVLEQSFWFSMTHPLLGVGPGEFTEAEAGVAKKEGRRGNWHETHNAYTQVSSEAGIPALIFFVAALVSTFLVLKRTRLRARAQAPTKQNRMISIAVFCMTVSLIGFSVAIFFLSLAYRFYLPALTGVAIALARAAEHEWSLTLVKPPLARNVA